MESVRLTTQNLVTNLHPGFYFDVYGHLRKLSS